MKFVNRCYDNTFDIVFVDYHIDEDMNGSEIIALINACNPWNTGADATLLGEQIKIISATLTNKAHHNSQEGTILLASTEGGLKVACSENQIIEIHLLSTDEGIMTAKDYIDLKRINNLILN
jgi:methionyl-tRNA formyltransferase